VIVMTVGNAIGGTLLEGDVLPVAAVYAGHRMCAGAAGSTEWIEPKYRIGDYERWRET